MIKAVLSDSCIYKLELASECYGSIGAKINKHLKRIKL